MEAGPHEDRLIHRIFHVNEYYQSSRPVPNESSAIEVKFGLTLQQIIDVVSVQSGTVAVASVNVLVQPRRARRTDTMKRL